jgi:hypothetical protein
VIARGACVPGALSIDLPPFQDGVTGTTSLQSPAGP